MTYYAIRDNETGLLLPVGGSKAEFVAGKAPRLFRTKTIANNALECWREGHWVNDIDQYGDGDGLVPGYGKFNVERSAKRKMMDLSVVSVTLNLEQI